MMAKGTGGLPCIEDFDGFVVVRAGSSVLDASFVSSCLKALEEVATRGETLAFLDLGTVREAGEAILSDFAKSLSRVKARYSLEVVLLCESEMAKCIQFSPLAREAQFFERKEEPTRLERAQRVVSGNTFELYKRLEQTLDGAIEVALRRWIGRGPLDLAPVSDTLNPLNDVVSVVSMNVDGCLFRVFLSSSHETLRGMVENILKIKIGLADPLVTDGACELLNYLTAFFKQHLSGDDSVVETEAPQLLQPDQMMQILDMDLQAHRVQTQYGEIKIWLETAA